MKQLIAILGAAACLYFVWRGVFAADPNYLHADEFKVEMSSSSRPTAETMGMRIRFGHIEGGPEACAGIEVEDRGMEVELRLVRADAPDVQADFPLTITEKGPTVVFEHPRVAGKGQGVQYTFYGKGGEIAEQWTVTPTID